MDRLGNAALQTSLRNGALSVVVVPPAGDGVVRPDAAGVKAAGRDGLEGA